MSRIVKSSRIVLKDDETYKVGNSFQTDNPEVTLVQEQHQKDGNASEKAIKIITKAGVEANEITAKAKAHADELIAKAKEESMAASKAIEDAAREKGYNEGYSKGAAEAERLKAEAQELYEKTMAEREETIRNLEPEMVDLILKAVKKLAGDIAVIKPDIVVNLIKQGLADATITGSISIRVSREDYDFVSAQKEEISSFAEGAASVDIIKDLSLNKSDCIIETQFGIIDTSLDGQFAALKDSLYLILS